MNYDKLLSSSGKEIKPSGIRKFFDIVYEMKDAISLGVGEPDFITPWHIRESGIYSLEKGFTHYTSNAGMAELRREILKYLKRRFDLDYQSESEVLITVGGSEAIDLAIRAVINPGDEVLIPEPSFVCYCPCTALAGGIPVRIPTKMENNFRLEPDEIKKRITKKTKLLILPYPNNPTGAILEKEDLEKIREIVDGTDILIMSDEIYAELTYNKKHISIASLPGMKERTILVSGFSKCYAMTGWRIGYAVAPKEIMDIMHKIHQYAIMCSPTTAQYAAIEAMKNGDDDIEHMKSEYNYRRSIIYNGFKNIGLDCFEPLGAFYVFPSIKKTGLSSADFCEKLLFSKKVALVPGDAFGESGEGFVRVSYCSSIEKINTAIEKIGEFLNE